MNSSGSGSLLAWRSVCAGYDGRIVIENFTLSVDSPSIVGVFGANGSGKSTLLKAVIGLCDVPRGQILVDGINVVGLATDLIARRSSVMYVAERHRLFPSLTVAENVRVAVHGDWPRAAARLPEGEPFWRLLDRVSRRRAAVLSGGEQQAVALAIGVLKMPRFLLLDEPLTGLAPQLAPAVGLLLKRLRSCSVVTVLVEHQIETVLPWIDVAVVLRGGLVSHLGAPAELQLLSRRSELML